MLKLTWSAHPKFSMIRDPISRQVVHHKAHQIIVPTCERPMVREDPKLRGSLNTPDERCTCQVRMAGSVGFLFLALPILTFWWFFLVFFLLNLGFASPNYFRKSLWDQVRPHSIKKIGGRFYPNASKPGLRAWQVQRSSGVFRHFPRLLDDGGGIPKSQGRGWRFDSRL